METEHGSTLATMFQARMQRRRTAQVLRRGSGEIVSHEIAKTNLGGETFAETLYALLPERDARCPISDCGEHVTLPEPGRTATCTACGAPVYLTDGLRIHEQFVDHRPASECHARFRTLSSFSR